MRFWASKNQGRMAVVLAAGAAWMGGNAAHAASATWLGTTDATWTGANWSASPAPGTGETATFSNPAGAVNGNTTLSLTAVTVNTVLFDNAGAAAYTIGAAAGSGTLTINTNGAITVNAGVVNDQVFNANLAIATTTNSQSITITHNGAGLLTFTGAVSTGFSGVKTLQVGGSGNVLISGNYSNGSGSNLGLSKTGEGTLTLSGANGATGTFAVSEGTLVLANASGGNSISGGLLLNGGSVRLGGSGGDQIASGNAANLITIHSGTFDLNGRNEAVRGFTGTGGVVTNTAANTTSTLNSTQNQVTTFAGRIIDGASGTGIVALALGQGVKTLTGNNTYSGGTSIGSGVVALGGNTALGSGAITFTAGSSTLRSDSDTARTLSNAVNTLNGVTFGSATIGQAGHLALGALSHTNGTVTVSNARTSFSSLTTTGAFAKAGAGALEIGGNGNLASALTLGGGLFAIGGNATFGGNVAFNSGTLGIHGVFTRSLGGGASQVTWQSGASGGFAAYGGDLAVLLNNSNAVPLSWSGNGGSSRFVPSGQALIFSDALATGTVDFQNAIDLNGASQTVLVHDGAAAIDATLSGILSSGGLNKTGGGTLELTNTSTYAGATTLSAGTLLVNGSIANSAVIVNGGTLGGTGITGDITLNGTGALAPGNGIGTLAAEDVTFADGGTYHAEIGSGAAADLINANGTLNLGSSLDTLNLIGLTSSFDGSPRTIASYAGLVGTFDTVTLNGAALLGTPSSFLVNGQNYKIDYGSGTDDSITITVVPEPALAGLLGLGVVGLLSRRRGA